MYYLWFMCSKYIIYAPRELSNRTTTDVTCCLPATNDRALQLFTSAINGLLTLIATITIILCLDTTTNGFKGPLYTIKYGLNGRWIKIVLKNKYIYFIQRTFVFWKFWTLKHWNKYSENKIEVTEIQIL